MQLLTYSTIRTVYSNFCTGKALQYCNSSRVHDSIRNSLIEVWFITLIFFNVSGCIICFIGCDTVDNVLCVLLTTSMLVGGLIGFILDNIIPGWISFFHIDFHICSFKLYIELYTEFFYNVS